MRGTWLFTSRLANTRHRARPGIRPRVEVLEDRLTPAAVTGVTPSPALIVDATVGSDKFSLTVTYDAAMDTSVNPTISFPTTGENPAHTITLASSSWTNNTIYVAKYNVADANAQLLDVDVKVSGGKAADATIPADFAANNNFDIDTQNPTVTSLTTKRRIVADSTIGKKTFVIDVKFSEAMNQSIKPQVRFPEEKPGATLIHQSGSWLNSTTYRDVFNVRDLDVLLDKIDIRVTGAKDLNGNTQVSFDQDNYFTIDTRNPRIVSFAPIGFDAGSGILRYGLIFDLPVNGLSLDDLAVEADGLSGAAIDSITGSGTQFQIGVFVGSGFGQLRLKLIDDDSIRFLKGRNRLEGNNQTDGGFTTTSVSIIRFGGIGFML